MCLFKIVLTAFSATVRAVRACVTRLPSRRGAIESTGIARGVSLSRGGTSLSASPARGRVGTDTKTYSDLPAVGTDGTDGKGANRTAALRPVFIRS